MKLYEIAEQFKAVELLANDEDMNDEAIRDTLESISFEFEDKAKACAAVVLNLKSNSAAIDAEIKRLQQRKKTIENNVLSLQNYLLHNMQQTKISSIKTPLFNVTLNTRRSKSVEVDIDNLDRRYLIKKVSLSADKKELSERLKNGEQIKGAQLVVKDTLTIK